MDNENEYAAAFNMIVVSNKVIRLFNNNRDAYVYLSNVISKPITINYASNLSTGWSSKYDSITIM